MVSCLGNYGIARVCFWRHDLKINTFLLEMEGQKPQPQAEPLKFSLVLESKHRTFLRKEKLSHKKGKSRKLTKQDEADIEEELLVCRFNADRIRKQALEEAYHTIQLEEHRRKEFEAKEREKLLAEVNGLKAEAKAEDVAEKQAEDLSASVASAATE